MMIGKIGSGNTTLPAAAINQSVAHKNEALYGKSGKNERIQAVISPLGKKQNLIQQLMKQKQELTDRMNSLSADENDTGINIQDQMKEYQKQLEELDKQIYELQSEKQEDTKKEQSNESGIYDKPKTKSEADAEKLNTIAALAFNLDQAETIQSVKNQLDGRTRVLNAEVKTGNGNIEAKLEEISELETKSSGLAEEVSGKIVDTSRSINQIRTKDTDEEPIAQSSDDSDNS